MKKILVLGGTQFIGRNLVDELIKNPDVDLTLFNRQRTGSSLFPEVKKIKGDRETADVNQIAQTDWDCVIDLSCYFPESLEGVLNVLPKSVKKYILISSCSAYDNHTYKLPLKDESTPLLSCSALQRVDRTNDSYGQRKAECERILAKSTIPFVILRPALVYGKYDVTDRFYYWLYQVKMNKDILLPDEGLNLFSTTYVMDLVSAISAALVNREEGAFNVITTPETSIGEIVKKACAHLEKNPEKYNATADLLGEQKVTEWMDMPLWIAGNHFTYSNQKMIDSLGFGPTELPKGLSDSLAYFESKNWPVPQYGISEEKRMKLLKLVKAQSN